MSKFEKYDLIIKGFLQNYNINDEVSEIRKEISNSEGIKKENLEELMEILTLYMPNNDDLSPIIVPEILFSTPNIDEKLETKILTLSYVVSIARELTSLMESSQNLSSLYHRMNCEDINKEMKLLSAEHLEIFFISYKALTYADILELHLEDKGIKAPVLNDVEKMIEEINSVWQKVRQEKLKEYIKDL